MQGATLIRPARSLRGRWFNESGHLVLPRLRIVDESVCSFACMSHDCMQITAMPWYLTFTSPLSGRAAFATVAIDTHKRSPFWCPEKTYSPDLFLHLAKRAAKEQGRKDRCLISLSITQPSCNLINIQISKNVIIGSPLGDTTIRYSLHL